MTGWIDRTQQIALTSFDDSARRIERIRLGAVAGVDATTNGACQLRLRSRRDDGTNTYTYDSANRLTSISNQSTVSMRSNQYNGLGDRLSQTVNSVTTNYVLDLNAGLTQVLADGTNTYLYGNGRIGELQPGGWAYHLGDALGSVRQLADGSGAVTLAKGYEPYGSGLRSVGSGMTIYQYTGEIGDTGTGFTFLRARYLNNQIGRFISRDTYAGNYHLPLTLNKWNYTEGNPVNRTDPSGMISVTEAKDGDKIATYLESTYGVRIMKDWGWVKTYQVTVPVSLYESAIYVCCQEWNEGAWRNIKELES